MGYMGGTFLISRPVVTPEETLTLCGTVGSGFTGWAFGLVTGSTAGACEDGAFAVGSSAVSELRVAKAFSTAFRVVPRILHSKK
jgi:hypothetical protein